MQFEISLQQLVFVVQPVAAAVLAVLVALAPHSFVQPQKNLVHFWSTQVEQNKEILKRVRLFLDLI